MEQPDSSEIKRLGLKDGFGHYFSTSLVKDNLISNANDYIEPIELDGNSGSPNLYADTRDFDNPTVWNNFGGWTKTGEVYDGMTVMSTTGDWNGLSQNWAAKNGETYTFSVYARYNSGTGKSIIYTSPSGFQYTNIRSSQYSLNETWQRISFTFMVTVDGNIEPRLERTNDNTNTLLIAGPKLERGTVATPYSPAPSEQTVSKSGSLVIPVVNINSNSSYAFSMISNASDDIANASLNLIVKDSSGNDISSVISNSISSGKHVLNIGLSTGANFSSNGYAILQYSGIDISKSLYASLLCIKVVTDNLISNANSWSPNSNDEQLTNEINVELDIKSFINDNISTLSSSTTSSDINAMFQEKRFQITSKLNDITTPSVTVNPYVFNYNANVFMSLDSFTVDNSGYKDYFIDFNDVTPFINSNGIMSFKLVPENYKNGLSIDYFGLGIYNTTDGEVLDANKSQSGMGLDISESYSSVVGKAIVDKSEVE